MGDYLLVLLQTLVLGREHRKRPSWLPYAAPNRIRSAAATIQHWFLVDIDRLQSFPSARYRIVDVIPFYGRCHVELPVAPHDIVMMH